MLLHTFHSLVYHTTAVPVMPQQFRLPAILQSLKFPLQHIPEKAAANALTGHSQLLYTAS
jgi:hypothetical protein